MTPPTGTVGVTLLPNGDRVTYRVDYGPTSACGSSTPETTLRGSLSAPVTVGLAGLSPNSTVHYRVVATTDAGTAETADVTFTTPGVARRHRAAPATDVTQTAATAAPLVVVPPAPLKPKLSLAGKGGRQLLLSRRDGRGSSAAAGGLLYIHHRCRSGV